MNHIEDFLRSALLWLTIGIIVLSIGKCISFLVLENEHVINFNGILTMGMLSYIANFIGTIKKRERKIHMEVCVFSIIFISFHVLGYMQTQQINPDLLVESLAFVISAIAAHQDALQQEESL